MHFRMLLAAVAFCTSGAVCADSLDINLNNDTVQGDYATKWRTAEFSIGGLYNNDRNDWFADAGLLAYGEKDTPQARYEAGLGGRIYAASVSNNDILALGLGGQFRFFPGNGPIAIGGYFYYAPDVVTFMDGKKFWEGGLRVEYEIIKKTASIYLGTRKVRADLDDGSHETVDSGGNVGVKIVF
ncbi:MAG TPA: YfaZ family outer membrane protein [Candidatus Methylomirabilis sp.]|nr:YfaZ family outer membrane protein [Candidatus Methylomirabilis sp.]